MNRKADVLKIMDILNRRSDEDHPVSTRTLIEELKNSGSAAQRKSVYSCIEALKSFGVDVMYTGNSPKGYFIGQRDFEVAQVRLLVDAVLTAPFITEKKTKELIGKLKKLLSEHQARQIEGQVHFDGRVKFSNEEIYYVIDAINDAIAKNKNISFKYHHRKLARSKAILECEKEFIVSPYALIWSNDRYYLAGANIKYDDITNFRLDRMKRVKILKQDRRHISQVNGFTDEFDSAAYVKKNTNMFPGESCTITLRCKEEMLDIVVDKFGEDCLLNACGTYFDICANVYLSRGLINWLVQYGDSVVVKSPQSLKDDVRRKINDIYKAYSKDD